jgi:flagellar hook-basal body complex protein FliE
MPTIPGITTGGAEWQIGAVDKPAAGQSGGGGGFGAMIGDSIKSLQTTQDQAASASNALAAGTATDPTSVVMAVERAQLAMQLASQIRNKAVEAAQAIFSSQV